MASGTILDTIIERKMEEVEERSARWSLNELRRQIEGQEPCRGFVDAIIRNTSQSEAAIIAEIKKASPSKGLIRPDFNPEAIARSYESAGATCLSVLTDVDFFQGADAYLQRARAVVSLPVLRKDFIVSPYQVYESRALGADCILLIAAVLELDELQSLYELAVSLELDVLIEIHDESELQKALSVSPRLLGINNRDLKTFEVNLDVSLRLLTAIPDGISVVTESGIADGADVLKMMNSGVYGFLIGEAFMKAPDPGAALRSLFT